VSGDLRDSIDNAREAVPRAALIHREIFQLTVLIFVAVAAFWVTRAVAASNHEMNLRDAAEWFRRGQEAINAGRVDDAIDSFRRATVKDRSNKRFVLALAEGLALRRDGDAARSLLLTLRESAPEDADINLQLARLAAARSDVTEALRFYHNALYAPWSLEQPDARRGIRFELIRFLVAHGQSSRAISELLALSSDLPDDVPLHLEAARLFVKAGDNGHAMDQFQRVLRLAPQNAEALAGAGLAAFRSGDYVVARTYLRRAPDGADDVASTRQVVDLVLSNDPLSNRLGSAERRRRLAANLSNAEQRLTMCMQQVGGEPASDQSTLRDEANAFEGQLKPGAALEQDTVESGVDLIARIERLVAEKCGPPSPLDQALILIGHQHGG
jgi:Flp pilus assembly protein TadD